MSKIASQVFMMAVVALGFVFVNAFVVYCVAGNGCPDVGVTSVPCIDEEGFDMGGCRLGLVLIEGGSKEGTVVCFGGSLSVDSSNELKFGVDDSQITSETVEDCYTRINCTRKLRPGASGSQVVDYYCETKTDTGGSVTFTAGNCPE